MERRAAFLRQLSFLFHTALACDTPVTRRIAIGLTFVTKKTSMAELLEAEKSFRICLFVSNTCA